MTPHLNAIMSMISILMLWVALFWFYREFRTDTFRQSLFALRDEFFDDAAAGKIPFDSRAYGILRTTINGMIRFAHQLTLAQFIVIAFRKRRTADSDRQIDKVLSKAIAELTPEQNRLCTCYVERLHLMVVKHLIMSSPLLVVFVLVPIFGYAIVKELGRKIYGLMEDDIRRIDSFAYVLGGK